MAHNFLTCDRDQAFLMPPSVTEWLPEDHLVWFILDVVDELDLGPITAFYREDGWGRAAHHPAMMVALLLYAYCIGERSSRRIERRCHEDVAFRVICANRTPDHATIARFRRRHARALAGLLTDSLALCARAGLVRVGTVAVDGTKVAANASRLNTVDRQGLQRRIEQILVEAEEVDQAEDQVHGETRGDELPKDLRRRDQRLARLRELREQLEAEQAERRATNHRHKDAPVKVNTTDSDSRLFQSHQGWVQGYNAQAVVSEDQIVLHAEAVAENDVGLLEPMLQAAKENLERSGGSEQMGVLLADAGYWSEHNAALELGPELLIATGKHQRIRGLEPPEVEPCRDPPVMPPDPPADIEAAKRAEGARRADVMRRWVAGALDIHSAVAELGITNHSHAYFLRRRFLAEGSASLVPRSTEPLKLPRRPPLRPWMEAKLASERGRALYERRSAIAEPVFGQVKEARGIRRFLVRGLEACDSEWKLIATTHNLLKLWRSGRWGRDPLPAIA